MSEWISVEDRLPSDGTPVEVKVIMRFKKYKPQSQQFKQGIAGRWQEWNGYGWHNTDKCVSSWSPESLNSMKM